MKIKRNILGEKVGSAFGTIEFVLTDSELAEAHNEYLETSDQKSHKDMSAEQKKMLEKWLNDLVNDYADYLHAGYVNAAERAHYRYLGMVDALRMVGYSTEKDNDGIIRVL